MEEAVIITRKAFVMGATGLQGGAVARRLRAAGWDVVTISRDPNTAAARSIASTGVEVRQACWTDLTTLQAAMAGCESLYLNLMPDLERPVAEFEQGRDILGVAREVGVRHVVYSSAMALQIDRTDHIVSIAFQPKADLEQLLQTFGFPRWTILRPGFFMSNFVTPRVQILYPAAAESGLFRLAWKPTDRLPMVDHEDIGKYGAAALGDPDRFHEKILDVISDVVKVNDAMETMRRLTRRMVHAKYLLLKPATEHEGSEAVEGVEGAAMPETLPDVLQKVAARLGDPLKDYDAASEAVKWGITEPPTTFEQFVGREIQDFKATFAFAF
ncbi:hypothetical protein C7999DRAFT_16993 [Corynascus novoguineensis]|uniref:NmrA-like domain-containing protein n=1 Tax=Corynascus novoguineensis TaxID=1126955 RepID=A0AAN7HGP7_9PEZI|nr:hypothetical protein C7999DRAFT_16993 [Corynascus novoguineensis]